MEAVGAAASFIQIFDAAIKTAKYLEDIKNASGDRKKLTVEAASLRLLLEDLKGRVEKAKPTDPWFQGLCSLGEEGKPLRQFQLLQTELEKKLKHKSKLRSYAMNLVWTLSKEKINDILSTIEQQKSSINYYLQKDQFDLIINVHNDVRDIKHDQKLHQILEWISLLDFQEKQDGILSARQEGTGHWLLNSDEFKNWTSGVNRVLWCPGAPGAGKTVLAAITINRLQMFYEGKDIGIAFLYCSYDEQSTQTPINLVSSLLKQLAWRNAGALNHLERLYKEYSSKSARPNLGEILKTLNAVILSFSKVFIIIDALDECPTDGGNQRSLLDALVKLPDNAGILFTSRPSVTIDEYFPATQKLEISANKEDIQMYLEARISQKSRLRPFIQEEPALGQRIAETVSRNVQGMFLIARLQMDSLEQQITKNSMEYALNHLPKKLDDIYKLALQRIKSEEEVNIKLATGILMWLTYAVRPLSLTELRHALAVKPEANKLDKDDLVKEEKALLEVCAGLVTVDHKSNTIRLVHHTTQDYMKRVSQDWFPTAQIEIARTCLTYLVFDVFASGPCPDDEEMEARIKQNPFLIYAALYWGDHTRGDNERTLWVLVLRLLESTPQLISCAQVTSISQYRSDGYSQDHPWNLSGLHVAAACGHEAIVRLLLDKGADVEARDRDRGTALMGAATGGHEAIVRLLLDKGADVEARGSFYGRTALTEAAAGGYEAIVRLLLDKGADVEAKGSFYGRTALGWAAVGGHEAIVRLLLDKGADVEAKDSFYGRTALGWAANKGHEAVVRLLLDKGADVEAKDSFYGGTALMEAAVGGHEAVVQLLRSISNCNGDLRDSEGGMGMQGGTAKAEDEKEEKTEDKGW